MMNIKKERKLWKQRYVEAVKGSRFLTKFTTKGNTFLREYITRVIHSLREYITSNKESIIHSLQESMTSPTTWASPYYKGNTFPTGIYYKGQAKKGAG